MSKTHYSVALFLLLVGVLFLHSVSSARSNFLEGLDKFTMDPSTNPIINTVQSSLASGTLPNGNPIPTTLPNGNPIPTTLPNGNPIPQPLASATSTESFETIFDKNYANANNWNNSSLYTLQDNVKFKPECCNQSQYSTSGGCACLNSNYGRKKMY